MSVVLLDCDGVLAQFVEQLVVSLADRGHVVDPQPRRYDFIRGFGEEVGTAARDLLRDPLWWRRLSPYADAQAGVRAIRSKGHEVVVVTSPWKSCHSWAKERGEWLHRYFEIEDHQYIPTKRKDIVRGAAFIDDHDETVIAWHKLGGIPRLMDRPWTQDSLTSLPRFTWGDEDVASLLDHIAIWERA